MCRFKNRGTSKINLSDLYNILKQAKALGTENLVFGTTAEPTQYDNLSYALQESKRLGFSLGLVTNFNFINRDANLIKSLGLIDALSISIDAATKEVYGSIRKGGKWDLLFNNLNSFKDFCKSKKVIARFTIQKNNIQEISKFVEFVRSFRFFKEIVYEPVNFNFISSRNRKLIEWDYKDLLLLKKELSLAYKKAKDYGLECKQYLTAGVLSDNKNVFSGKGYQPFSEKCFQSLYDNRYPLRNPCYLPSRSLFISSERKSIFVYAPMFLKSFY